MDANSGKMWSEDELQARGLSTGDFERLVPVPAEIVRRVQYLTRRQRRAWCALVQRGVDREEALREVQRAEAKWQ
ncbi:MAG TPA: hypothetical protein VGI39_04825 [Polyangiaceae bacterium]|jgi:hypothetical protein